MTYRDPLEAARVRAEAARQRVLEIEERLSPKLEPQLPARLRERLGEARVVAQQEPEPTLEGWRDHEAALDAYAALLEETLEAAPRIEARYNSLPDAFPGRMAPRGAYTFPDVYQPAIVSLRRWCHGRLRALDPEVTLHDARAGYFDTQEEPFLVDASFTARRTPLRLHVTGHFKAASNQNTNVDLPVGWLRTHIVLLSLLPGSAPRATLTHQGLVDRALLALRLKREAVIGDPAIDELFVIDAAADDAQALFGTQVKRALLALASKTQVERLELSDGIARLELDGRGDEIDGLDEAIDVLAALRASKPVRLLRGR